MTELNPDPDHGSACKGGEAFDQTPLFDTSDFQTSTESRPNGDLVLIVESPLYGIFKRVVPRDLKDPAEFVNRVKLDLLIRNGKLPRDEILQAARKDRIPTYTLGKLHKTRYASLWEDRRIRTDDPQV